MKGRCKKLLEQAKESPQNLRFSELQRLAVCFGFEHDRTKGSHHIYLHPESKEGLNLQPGRDGKAQKYQVRQLLDMVDES